MNFHRISGGVYIYIYICIRIYMYVRISYIYIYTCTRIYMYIYICKFWHPYTCRFEAQCEAPKQRHTQHAQHLSICIPVLSHPTHLLLCVKFWHPYVCRSRAQCRASKQHNTQHAQHLFLARRRWDTLRWKKYICTDQYNLKILCNRGTSEIRATKPTVEMDFILKFMNRKFLDSLSP